MSKKTSVLIIVGIVLVLLGGAVFFGRQRYIEFSNSFAEQAQKQNFNSEELVNLVKPSIVRIVQHVTGEAVIPAFTVNLRDFTVDLIPDETPFKLPIDTYLTGTGFIVNPDGYVMTNAHVISDSTIKLEKVGGVAYMVILDEAMKLSEEEANKITQDERGGDEFGKKIIRFVMDRSVFKLEKKLYVFNPSSAVEKFADIETEGFPATVTAVNDDYFFDSRDVGLIKIDKKGMPALRFGKPKDVNIGNKVHIFGFPATADFVKKNLNESTFTVGVIGSIKDSENKDFKIFQTDAKISEGSSGGPLFNDRGEVIGIVTYETNEMDRNSGDNFAFAIPITLGEDVLKDQRITNREGDYGQHFAKGLAYLHGKQCQKALAEFGAARSEDDIFVSSSRIDQYIQQCNDLIASGQSVDSRSAVFKLWIKSVSQFTWLVIGLIGSLVVLAAIVILLLFKRLNRDEKEINQLENEIDTEKLSSHSAAETNIGIGASSVASILGGTSSSGPVAATKPAADPQLAKYIADARMAGMTSETILEELKKAGWPEADVADAMK